MHTTRKTGMVEHTCSPDKLKKMVNDIGSYWEEIGKDKAFWSVITNEKYLEKNLDKNLDTFYESGKAIAKLALSYVDTPNQCKALELGCGTGRVSLHLSRECKELIGCDISRPHLALAEKHLEERQSGSIQFRNILRPEMLLDFGQVDFIFSVITLQHNPPPVIAEYIRAFCKIIKPGGTIFFQLPTSIDSYSFTVDEYLDQTERVMEMHMLPAQIVKEIVEENHCDVVEQFENDMVGSPTVYSEVFIINKKRPI